MLGENHHRRPEFLEAAKHGVAFLRGPLRNTRDYITLWMIL